MKSVSNGIIELRAGSVELVLFEPGERVHITDGPFAGLEAIYQLDDGERRAMVLIELLHKPTRMAVAPASLRKV